MFSAATFATVLQHPASPLSLGSPPTMLARMPMGLAMGLTAISIIYSPWGRRSGAHMNPAVTLTFLRLGKVAPIDDIAFVDDEAAEPLGHEQAHGTRGKRALDLKTEPCGRTFIPRPVLDESPVPNPTQTTGWPTPPPVYQPVTPTGASADPRWHQATYVVKERRFTFGRHEVGDDGCALERVRSTLVAGGSLREALRTIALDPSFRSRRVM